MAMSVNTARALEQVKVGLAILYGANYFTEDEWIKIHSLIRTKQYGSTARPISHILDDEEPLIFFPNSKEDVDIIEKDICVLPSKAFERDIIVISETEIQSIDTQEPAATAQFLAEDLSMRSATMLLDNQYTHSDAPMAAVTPAQTDFSAIPSGDDNSQVGNSMRDYLPGQSNGDATIDLGSTKDFKNPHSKHDLESNTNQETHSSDVANTSERELWTHSSVTDVDSDEIASPTQYQEENQQYANLHAASTTRTIDGFSSVHDINNARPTRTTKSLADSCYARDPSSGEHGSAPQIELTPGTIVVAQVSFQKTSKIHVDICCGDSVKVMKKVSGIMYHGENLRTNHAGQFPSTIFQRSARERTKKSEFEMHKMAGSFKISASLRDTSLSNSSDSKDLDKVEDMNAAEWDKDDTSVITAPMTMNSGTHDIAGMKYSAFGGLSSQGHRSESTQQEVMAAMMSKMLNEKLQSLQSVGRSATGSNGVSSARSNSRNTWNEPLKPVPPKTHICWFYATPNKECRFTAEECRDLHVLSAPGLTFALHNGKPTWGAAADYASQSDFSTMDSKKGERACWYWANANCEYTAESCRYQHKHVPAGVMPKPGRSKKDYWRRDENDAYGSVGETEPSMDGWGEASTDLLDSSAWGETSTEKYKPPHIKALEEKEQMRSEGW